MCCRPSAVRVGSTRCSASSTGPPVRRWVPLARASCTWQPPGSATIDRWCAASSPLPIWLAVRAPRSHCTVRHRAPGSDRHRRGRRASKRARCICAVGGSRTGGGHPHHWRKHTRGGLLAARAVRSWRAGPARVAVRESDRGTECSAAHHRAYSRLVVGPRPSALHRCGCSSTRSHGPCSGAGPASATQVPR